MAKSSSSFRQIELALSRLRLEDRALVEAYEGLCHTLGYASNDAQGVDQVIEAHIGLLDRVEALAKEVRANDEVAQTLCYVAAHGSLNAAKFLGSSRAGSEYKDAIQEVGLGYAHRITAPHLQKAARDTLEMRALKSSQRSRDISRGAYWQNLKR